MAGMSGVGSLDSAGAVFLLLWAVGMWVAVGALHIANRRRRAWVFGATSTVIMLGIIGQIGHLQEHVAQVGYWVLHPEAPTAWMTPWGTALAKGFQLVDPGRLTLGMEILHFVGNCIFLAGLVAVMVITSRAGATKARRWAKMGVWMQGIHGLEHLSLMLSVWLGAKHAIGLSTWFGLLDAGPGATTYRVWWHFIANVIGSVIFAIALYHLWKERRVVQASFIDTSIDNQEIDDEELAELTEQTQPV
jgi:NADH:ubiquinone oxidoreductase subunit 6 (subunit J)